jgi:hypothetical protein
MPEVIVLNTEDASGLAQALFFAGIKKCRIAGKNSKVNY